MKIHTYLPLILLFLVCSTAKAQHIGIKTNLLHLATASPNFGVEMGLANRWTLDVSGGFNPFTFSGNKKWKHWLVQPEARYWFCERFYGSFIGIHAGVGEFNFSRVSIPFVPRAKDYRYEGLAIMGGLSYGHSWILGKRWNLEATIGLGMMYVDYKKFECQRCGDEMKKNDKFFLSPTRLSVNLIYMIK